MLSIYKNLSKQEKELIIKLILCTIIATAFSGMIGESYSPTTVITANLFLYCDRGYCGSIRYGIRRVVVQIVQGILVLGIIFPCKYYQVPINDFMLITLASVIAICIGLPINLRYTFSPLNCTLANATFIIAYTTVQDISAFPSRVLACTVGCLIGYFVNNLSVLRMNREEEIIERIKYCTQSILGDFEVSKYESNKKTLEFDLRCLKEDSEKGLKQHYCSPERMEKFLRYYGLLNDVELFKENYNRYSDMVDSEFLKKVDNIYEKNKKIHLKLIDVLESKDRIQEDALPMEKCIVNTNECVCIWASLYNYASELANFERLIMKT